VHGAVGIYGLSFLISHPVLFNERLNPNSEDTSVEHGYRAQHNAIKDFNPINVLERHAYQWTVALAS
jgi:hypothetical protein